MTSRTRFATPQRLFHWVMAACILAMLFIGIGMISTIAPKYLTLMKIHKSLGITILLLALIRLTLRFRYGAPDLPRDMPQLLKRAAIGSHYAFYALMIGMPLIGWGMLSAASHPVILAGCLHLPGILPVSPKLYTILWFAHYALALCFFGLILLHLAAALMHALIFRDGVFQTMASCKADDEP